MRVDVSQEPASCTVIHRQQDPLKRRQSFTRPHGVISQEKKIDGHRHENVVSYELLAGSQPHQELLVLFSWFMTLYSYRWH